MGNLQHCHWQPMNPTGPNVMNTHETVVRRVQFLHINVDHLTLAGTSSLSRFVSSSPSLSKVRLTWMFSERRTVPFSAGWQ